MSKIGTEVVVAVGPKSFKVGTICGERVTKRAACTAAGGVDPSQVSSHTEYQVNFEESTHDGVWFPFTALITDLTEVHSLRAFIPKR